MSAAMLMELFCICGCGSGFFGSKRSGVGERFKQYNAVEYLKNQMPWFAGGATVRERERNAHSDESMTSPAVQVANIYCLYSAAT